MQIKYVKAKNFLSIGEEPLYLNFEEYGNVVVIKGQNLDIADDTDSADEEHFSNASGKSTLIELLVYGLYGKLIRKVSHTEAINTANKKKLEVEVGFTHQNKNYHIIRTRKPDSLRLWEDDVDITVGGQPATQKQIDDIVKLNYKAFINVVCFGQHNSYNFLECDAGEQRSIVESILSLEVYKQYSDIAKEALKNIKQKVKDLLHDYENLKKNEELCKSRIKQLNDKEQQWKTECEAQINQLQQQVAKLEERLMTTNLGSELKKYEEAQNELGQLRIAIASLKEKKLSLLTTVDQARQKFDNLRTQHHQIGLDIKTSQQELKQLEANGKNHAAKLEDLENLKEGAECSVCHSKIASGNYKHLVVLETNLLESNQNKIDAFKKTLFSKQQELTASEQSVTKFKSLLDNADSKVKTIENELDQNQAKVAELGRMKRPDADSDTLLLQERIANDKEKLIDKRAELAGGGPYREILESTQTELDTVSGECATVKRAIEDTENLIPYYEFWVKAFGDDGIRSFVIEGIIPALNARIAYWLKVLINSKLKLTFDKKLDPCLERNPANGDPFVYNATCGGEKNRIDLAISQAFAHIVMLSSGTKPSLVFLDEVGANIDRRGIADVYKMICQLALEKQVFIITHNPNLLNMLQGADVITMKKENGFSVKI